jgi:EmrB/QacA subfamily drug resistance transporter
MTVTWGSPQGRGVLAATIAGAGLAMLDSTIVNVALPAIGADLEAPIAGLQWILNGYLLSLAALVLVAGSLGDRFGRRKVFLAGVVWFGLASMLCGLAWNTQALVVARILQGIGGALLTPGSLAILQAVFAPSDRSRAIGAWSGLSGVTAAIGPLIGGLLVQAGSWRLAFAVNLPVTALCVWLTLRYVPESRDTEARPPAWGGAVLGAVGLAGVTAALIEAPSGPDPPMLAAAVIGIVALAAFVLTQTRGHAPMIPTEMFANRTFVLANTYTFLVYGVLGGVFVLLVVQLQTSLRYSPTAAGMASLPITVLMLLLSARSGRLAQQVGPMPQLVVGPLLLAAGLLLMRRIVPGAGYLDTVLPAVAVFGLGLAVVVAPITATALAAASDRHAGVASGVNNAIARTGSLLVVAVLPFVAGLQGTEYADPAALTAGWRTALLAGSAVMVLAAVLGAGIDNRVLAPQEPTTPSARLGECLHCGVEAPPTYVRAGGMTRRRGAERRTE